MLDIRKRLFTFIAIAIGLLLALALFIWATIDRNTEEETPNEPVNIVEEEPNPAPVNTVPNRTVDLTDAYLPEEVVRPEADGERYVRQLAKIFVERFGSFSSQNDNRHIDDVLPLVTNRMGQWIQTQEVEQTQQYSGQTTRVVASSVESYTDTAATIAVSIQLDRSGSVTYRQGSVDLVKVNDEWLVDGLYYEEEL